MTTINLANTDNKLVPCRKRLGLPGLYTKLMNPEKTVTVVYFGGSITDAPGYRIQTAEWLDAAYPASINAVNAGVGGTGSDLGIFRIENDVLAHKPDLVFVEFAVNDCVTDLERIINAVEGIVRKIRSIFPECSICFVYTITEYMTKNELNATRDKPLSDWVNMRDGILFPSMVAHEAVADHYGIPSINFGEPVLRLLEKKKLVLTVARDQKEDCLESGKIPFSPDSVHPYPDTGHRIYTNAVIQHFPQFLETKESQSTISTLLSASNWEQAKVISPENTILSTNWEKLTEDDKKPKIFGKALPDIWHAQGGESISITFTGTAIGFMDVIGPKTGDLQMSLDGSPNKLVKRFDRFCTYNRKHYVILNDNLSPGEHTLTLKIDDNAPDKKTILNEKESGVIPEFPEATDWYLIQFLVVKTNNL